MIRRLRAQAVFNAVFMGLVLVGISACGAFRSSKSSSGGTPGLPDGHTRPLLEDGFSEATAAQRTAHDAQAPAADNAPLFESGDGDLTQGSSGTASATTDRVYLTIASDVPTNVSIDVGNDDSTTTDLTVGTPVVVATPAAGDRRGTGLGVMDMADDPLWAYGTRTFEVATATPAAGDFTVHLVDWSDATGNYVGGGVWSRVYDADGAGAGTELAMEFGAFVDGDDPSTTAQVEVAAGTATYRGHSYGRYTTLPVAAGEENFGFFAAKATLTAEFGTATESGTISGTISNFLFSRDNTFASGMESALEGVIGGADGLTIMLESATISSTDGTFAGDTSGELDVGAEVAAGAEQPTLDLAGEWGGRFYGNPAQTGGAPLLAGGTWGASGEEGDPEMGGFALSLIGSFGAAPTGVVPPTSNLMFGDTPVANGNHAKYAAAAGATLLFVDNASTPLQVSSVTQGSAGTADRVYLTITDGAPVDATGVSIDVGNDGSTTTADLASAAGEADTVPTAAPLDRRRGTMLGTADDATDPVWDYTTRSYTAGTSGTPAAGDIAVTFVDWSAGTDAGGYMGGGVWSRATGTGATDMEFGAFIDGDDPFTSAEVNAAIGTATYRGHAYGQYSLNENIMGESGPGYFAAKATLTADFGDATAAGTVSGTVSDFLFSADNAFTAASTLETAIGGASGLTIMLGEATISATANSFTGTTTSNTIQVGAAILELAGNWGGRFYGGPARTGYLPRLVGGTFGATGEITGGRGFSLIGAFGARFDYGVDLVGVSFGTTAHANHAKYVAATGNWLLLDTDDTDNTVDEDDSSVTQGSVREDASTDPATGNRTNDAVYFTAFTPTNTALRIDIGNDAASATIIASDAGTVGTAAVTTDLRVTSATNTSLGTLNSITDPAWDYATNSVTGGTVDTAGYITATFVDWSDATGNYLGGGVWSRRTGTGATDLEFGAFVDGEDPTLTAAVNAATGMATYRGHAYGQYSFSTAVQDSGTDEANPGYFAAKATLTANFLTDTSDATTQAGTVSGTISDFLFSEDNSFTAAMESELEDAIGGADGLTITLASATISNTANSFEGTTASNRIRAGSEFINLAGNWGGRFYGTPNAVSRNRPQLVGGTFGAAGANSDDSLQFSLIGSFGAKYDTTVDLTSLSLAGATADANHAKYVLAAENFVLFDTDDTADADVVDSSVTQGSVGVDDNGDNRTDDAVFLVLGGATGATRTLTNVRIGVANDNSGDLDSDSTIALSAHDSATDQRDDIGWDYGTHEIDLGDNDGDDEFKAYAVDWTNLTGSNYMAGGVWMRRGTGATSIEVGAFVDGENPTEGSEVDAVTADTVASYSGHAFGRYSFGANGAGTSSGIGDGTTDEANPGFFAARATLDASFAATGGTISGVVSDFRFSQTAAFLAADVSALDAAAGGPDGLVITLEEATVAAATNNFESTTASNTIRTSGGDIDLTGRWGGRFYGTPATNAAPLAVGGTFGAAGDAGTDLPSLSIIGSFGAEITPAP